VEKNGGNRKEIKEASIQKERPALWPVSNQWSPSSCGPQFDKLRAAPLLPSFFCNFFISFTFLFWCYEEVWGWA
jgi:hypothetical protein